MSTGQNQAPDRQRVVIVGAGFAGLAAAKELGGSPFEVTVIDRHNYHLFQPLLYQVATAGLSPADIASPIRSILRKQKNIQVVLANVSGIDIGRKAVIAEDRYIPYDILVLATGAQHAYFGHEEWSAHAPGLKRVDDATYLRRRILVAFEKAENELNETKRRALLTFVVVGGGPTGVEMAGAIAEQGARCRLPPHRSAECARYSGASRSQTIAVVSCRALRARFSSPPAVRRRGSTWSAGYAMRCAGCKTR